MQVDHTKNIIELKNVSFKYDNQTILENITLNIHHGDYLGIIGPNGSGKTTLLKIMLGLLKPHKGSVKLFGKKIDEFSEWYKVSYVAQKAVSFDLHFPITVREVVSMGRYGRKGFFKLLNQHDKEMIKKSLIEVGMWDQRNKIIGNLSGGQQQRVFIARALCGEPEVIFLDEPTVGVDTHAREQFYQLVKKLNKDLHLTLVLISHNIDYIAHEITEVAYINKTIIYDPNPKHFFKNHYDH